jgi:hypothetical protein
MSRVLSGETGEKPGSSEYLRTGVKRTDLRNDQEKPHKLFSGAS